MRKRLKKIFVILFFCILLMPLIFVSRQSGVASNIEKRNLAKFPEPFSGNIYNKNFCKQLGDWFNDSLGFRNDIVAVDALIRYYIFDEIKDMPLGAKGELAPYSDLGDYQHKNLLDESSLNEVVEAYGAIAEYLKEREIQVYYVQCWDKHSIYPEQYKDNIQIFGEVSLMDQVEQALIRDGSMRVVPIKEELLRHKEKYQVYGIWSDPWHWNQRGAFVAYQCLISEINQMNAEKYICLSEQDFNITMKDNGQVFFGAIHRPDMEEEFSLKTVKARSYLKGLTFIPEGPYPKHTKYLVNESVDNDDVLLIFGDSYFYEGQIVDYLAESFHTTLMFNASNVQNGQFEKVIDEYNPTLVIFENAERSRHRLPEAIGIAEELE